MTIMKLVDVCYKYGTGLSFETQALRNINLEIEEGETLGIIGATGSGKSTLLQHLNGLLKPASGRVFYRGADISAKEFDVRSLCAKVGMVFQYPEYQLFSEDVISDVMFGPLNIGLTKEVAEEKAHKALQMMGISENDYKKSPFELSGGQKRRVAIAGVVAMEPEVLVLDEPMAGLDITGQQELISTIMSLRKERRMTVVWSSHSMEDMAKYADTLAVMSKGTIVRHGPVREVFMDTEFLESVGLAAPEAAYIIRDLKDLGIDSGPITIEEAAQSILRAWNHAQKAASASAGSQKTDVRPVKVSDTQKGAAAYDP